MTELAAEDALKELTRMRDQELLNSKPRRLAGAALKAAMAKRPKQVHEYVNRIIAECHTEGLRIAILTWCHTINNHVTIDDSWLTMGPANHLGELGTWAMRLARTTEPPGNKAAFRDMLVEFNAADQQQRSEYILTLVLLAATTIQVTTGEDGTP